VLRPSGSETFCSCYLKLALFAVAFPASAIAGGASNQSSFLEFARGEGFCLRGLIPAIKWDPALGDDDAPVWGSFCDADAPVGRIVSEPFLAPSGLSFLISGYIGRPGLRLYVRKKSAPKIGKADFVPDSAQHGAVNSGANLQRTQPNFDGVEAMQRQLQEAVSAHDEAQTALQKTRDSLVLAEDTLARMQNSAS
jgi:hypothetical protein